MMKLLYSNLIIISLSILCYINNAQAAEITITDVNASAVIINGEYIGESSNFHLDNLPSGAYIIELVKDSAVRFTQKVELANFETYQLDIKYKFSDYPEWPPFVAYIIYICLIFLVLKLKYPIEFLHLYIILIFVSAAEAVLACYVPQYGKDFFFSSTIIKSSILAAAIVQSMNELAYHRYERTLIKLVQYAFLFILYLSVHLPIVTKKVLINLEKNYPIAELNAPSLLTNPSQIVPFSTAKEGLVALMEKICRDKDKNEQIQCFELILKVDPTIDRLKTEILVLYYFSNQFKKLKEELQKLDPNSFQDQGLKNIIIGLNQRMLRIDQNNKQSAKNIMTSFIEMMENKILANFYFVYHPNIKFWVSDKFTYLRILGKTKYYLGQANYLLNKKIPQSIEKHNDDFILTFDLEKNYLDRNKKEYLYYKITLKFDDINEQKMMRIISLDTCLHNEPNRRELMQKLKTSRHCKRLR